MNKKRGLNLGGIKTVDSECIEWDTLMFSGNEYSPKDMKIDHDLTSNKPILREDETYDFIYSSHTFEHLLQNNLDFVLRDSYRLLKPGGIIRITAPNTMMLFKMYKSNIRIPWDYGRKTPKNWHRFFWNCFQILCDVDDFKVCDKVSENEFLILLKDHGVIKTFDILREKIEDNINKYSIPLGRPHVNPLYPDKIISILNNIGFINPKQVKKNEGISPMVKSPFNTTKPEVSFYVIARK
jgi:predicted SAM-dependent methyltransferase